MASICKINGRWRALVRRKGHRPLSRYFATQKEAQAWARQVESDIDSGNAVLRSDAVTVSDLIDAFERIRASAGRPVIPTTNTRYMLDHLADDLGPERISSLTPTRMAKWARMRADQGAGGYTINMELSQLGTVLRHTAALLGLTVPDVVGAARIHLHYLQLISGGTKRTRRASDDELERVLAWMDGRDTLVAAAVRVACVTGLRRGEIARITWDDLDEKARAVLVRNRKHPRRIEARDELVPLLGEAWDVVRLLPRTDDRIFPVSVEKLSDTMTEATRELGIPNLHFHDLRRNATSRLRELGFDTYERKAITGHRSDEVHERYIAIDLTELHRKHDAAIRDSVTGQQRQRKGRGRRP